MSAGPLATGLVFSLKVDRVESTETDSTLRIPRMSWVGPAWVGGCPASVSWPSVGRGKGVMVGAGALFDRASCSSECPDCDLLANQGP